jgi:hypothetical protein
MAFPLSTKHERGIAATLAARFTTGFILPYGRLEIANAQIGAVRPTL